MASNRDKSRLKKALRKAGATCLQVRMAGILLGVNGIENALEFASGLNKLNRRNKGKGQLPLWPEATI